MEYNSEKSEDFFHNGWDQLRIDLQNLDLKRKLADYNTGSINQSAAFCLFALTNYFKPMNVAEVGTFIGKSTLAMAKALEENDNSIIHTCDFSNDIDLHLPTTTDIIQYKRKSSTEMFEIIKNKSISIDLFSFDGRITKNDLIILQEISSLNAIFVLDDFEGIEKGVANVIELSNIGLIKKYILIYPPKKTLLEKLGFMGGCTTACLIPLKLLAFTSQ